MLFFLCYFSRNRRRNVKEQNILNIEYKALEFLLEERKRQNLTEMELGKMAFPEHTNPRAKINAMYHMKTGKGKSLRLRMGDFCAMCQALGKSPPEEFFKIWASNTHD